MKLGRMVDFIILIDLRYRATHSFNGTISKISEVCSSEIDMFGAILG